MALEPRIQKVAALLCNELDQVIAAATLAAERLEEMAEPAALPSGAVLVLTTSPCIYPILCLCL